eukprot:m.85637 g.85637  ORF g.85637 m.85637 type:complete len:419 (-) comp14849_c0_seq9:119-1375(-)
MPRDTSINNLSSACPAFKGGCPFMDSSTPSLQAALKSCPAFKTGCPFKEAGSVGNLYKDLALAPESHAQAGTVAHTALKDLIETVHSKSMDIESTKGDCPVFQTGCPFKAVAAKDGSKLVAEPIVEDKSVDNLAKRCPSFAHGCPFAAAPQSLQTAVKACPAFKTGCPFKESTTVHTLYKELDHAPASHAEAGTTAHQGVTDMIQFVHDKAVKLEQTEGHCPVFSVACPFKKAAANGSKRFMTDDESRKLLANPKVQNLKQACPGFKEGCPFIDASIVAEAKTCPAFAKGCPFEDSDSVSSIYHKLGEAPASHAESASAAHKAVQRALRLVHEKSVGMEAATMAACPVFQAACPFKDAKSAASQQPLVEKPLADAWATAHYGGKKVTTGKCPVHNPQLVTAVLVLLVAVLIARLAGFL